MPARCILILAFLAIVPLTVAAHPSQRARLTATTGASLTLLQRTTQALPGSADLLLTIDDITANQSMTWLEWRDGERLFGPRSLRPQDSVEFSVAGEAWCLHLAHLHNELIGHDWARFELERVGASRAALAAAAEASPPQTSAQEIESLISAVAQLEGAVFIRNGDEHSATEAADHLRSKLRAARGQIRSAEDFIDKVASRSSLSGNPYALRLADGTTVDAGEWFRARLAELRAARH